MSKEIKKFVDSFTADTTIGHLKDLLDSPLYADDYWVRAEITIKRDMTVAEREKFLAQKAARLREKAEKLEEQARNEMTKEVLDHYHKIIQGEV